jgi:flagellar FliL protein
MSAAAPTIQDAQNAAPKKGKKKLIIMVVAAVLVLAIGGGVAMVMMKKKAAEAAAAADEDGGETAHAAAPKKGKDDHHTPPVFLPLEPFVVNLADKDADRFAQIGITLEIEDAKAAEELKAYMPSIRNGVLMVLSHKTSRELMELTGKQELALAIKREAVRPLGFDLPEPEKADADAKTAKDDGDDEDKPKKKKKKKAAAEEATPVKNVLFSSFIIQ